MLGHGLFYLNEAVQNPSISNFCKDKAERKEKNFNLPTDVDH